jgi:signal transduction histidine kinase
VKNELKKLFTQHTMLIASLTIALPLLAIFYLQYRALREQETGLSLRRKEAMLGYLRAVTKEVREHYSAASERVLRVPATAVADRQGRIIRDNPSRTRSLEAVRGVAAYYRQQEFKGAKRFFVVVATERQGLNHGEVFFYQPQRQAMERDPQAPELTAINVACAAYLIYIREGTVVVPSSVAIERDPNNRLILRPIADAEQKIVAVAGMVLDQDWFRREIAPYAIREALPKFFPAEAQDAIVTLSTGNRSSGNEKIHYSTQPTETISQEATLRFDFVYFHYSVGIRMGSATAEQWARRNLLLNLLLWGLTALFLIAGIALALRTAARARKLSQMKTDFIANVSHELRTPLASLLVFSDLLKRGKIQEPEKIREFGEHIETVGQKLAQVINNILDFSRLEAGQKSYHFEPCDLRAVVEETVEAGAAPLKQSGHVVRIEAPSEPLPPARMDASAISLVLTNLLDNAIKYSAGAPEIRVQLGQAGEFVTLAVTDQGIGIPRAEQEKIFEKFYRVSTGLVHDVKGSGLGLAIVKHIIEAHQGRVTVESEPGRGSIFTLYLPCAAEPRDAVDGPVRWMSEA